MEVFQQYLQRGLFEENFAFSMILWISFQVSAGMRLARILTWFLVTQAPGYIWVDYFMLTLNVI